MKNDNGGYILPYVLVVMTILCLVAVSMMSNTLMGLQTQQKSTERMQARYVAEGAVEKVVAQMYALDKISYTLGEHESMPDDGKAEKFKDAFKAAVIGFAEAPVTIDGGDYSDTANAYVFEIKVEQNNATVSCTVNFSCEVEQLDEITNNSDISNPTTEYPYKITDHKITYSTYTVTYS